MKGFTLVEVLVALGMVAVALSASLALHGSLVRRAEQAPEALLAELCARNRLAALRLSRQLPAPGQESVRCEQAHLSLEVLTTTSASNSADFRQVQVQVRSPSREGAVVLSLATVLGRY